MQGRRALRTRGWLRIEGNRMHDHGLSGPENMRYDDARLHASQSRGRKFVHRRRCMQSGPHLRRRIDALDERIHRGRWKRMQQYLLHIGRLPHRFRLRFTRNGRKLLREANVGGKDKHRNQIGWGRLRHGRRLPLRTLRRHRLR